MQDFDFRNDSTLVTQAKVVVSKYIVSYFLKHLVGFTDTIPFHFPTTYNVQQIDKFGLLKKQNVPIKPHGHSFTGCTGRTSDYVVCQEALGETEVRYEKYYLTPWVP